MLAAILIPCSVLAKDGRVSVSAPSSAARGEYIEVTVSADAGSDGIGTFQSKLSYDTALLEYVSGGGNSAQISGGSGAIAYTGNADERAVSFVLRFRTKGTGTAKINISYYLSGFNSGKTLVDSRKTLSVNIADAPVESPLPSEDVLDAMYFTVGDVIYKIMEYPPEHTAGLIISSGVYNSVTVPTAYFAGNTEKAYFFAENAAYPDTSQTLLYDIQTGTFAAYIPVSFYGTYLVTEWERPIPGYPEEAASPLSETMNHSAGEDFILVRAISPSGTEGYYFYDTREGTFQRAITEE